MFPNSLASSVRFEGWNNVWNEMFLCYWICLLYFNHDCDLLPCTYTNLLFMSRLFLFTLIAVSDIFLTLCILNSIIYIPVVLKSSYNFRNSLLQYQGCDASSFQKNFQELFFSSLGLKLHKMIFLPPGRGRSSKDVIRSSSFQRIFSDGTILLNFFFFQTA